MFKFLFELKDSHLLQSKNGYGFNLTKMMKDFFNGVNNIEEQYCYILANSIYSGGIDIINYLVDTNKIDINMNFKGLNLLHMAAILNNVEMGKFLIEKIDINILDDQKHTPLMYAIKNHSIEFINFLLHQSKTDINCQDILSFFLWLILFFNLTFLCYLNLFLFNGI